MLLTFNVRHGRDLSAELSKARQVAKFALQTGAARPRTSRTSASSRQSHARCSGTIRTTSHQGGPSRPADGAGSGSEGWWRTKELYISCLKLRLDILHMPSFEKVNQVELDKECPTSHRSTSRCVPRWRKASVDRTKTGIGARAALIRSRRQRR